MKHLALTLSIIGAILIAAGAISYFGMTHHVMSNGIRALYALGGIALGLGLISFIVHFAVDRRRINRNH